MMGPSGVSVECELVVKEMKKNAQNYCGAVRLYPV